MANLEERIQVRYDCTVCGIVKANLEVRCRRPEEKIMDWMRNLQHSLQHDHLFRSPGCGAKELTNVWIPMTGRPEIGGPVVS